MAAAASGEAWPADNIVIQHSLQCPVCSEAGAVSLMSDGCCRMVTRRCRRTGRTLQQSSAGRELEMAFIHWL